MVSLPKFKNKRKKSYHYIICLGFHFGENMPPEYVTFRYNPNPNPKAKGSKQYVVNQACLCKASL